MTARGVKPRQVVHHRYESYWLYGAVAPKTGEGFFLEMPALDAECFGVFLSAFSRAYPETMNVLVLDGAPAHVAKRLVVPENVVLWPLPAYAPELNPVERLWQEVRRKLPVGVPASLAALRESVADQVRSWTAEWLRSVTGYAYLIRAADALAS